MSINKCECEPGKECGYKNAAMAILNLQEQGLITFNQRRKKIMENYKMAKKEEGCSNPTELHIYSGPTTLNNFELFDKTA